MRPDFDSSAQAVIRYLDRAGAEVIYVSDVEAIFGSDVIAGNQRTANCIARFPDRIRGYIVINPWMGKACFENIRYWHARGFCGLKPYPGTFGHQISDPIMDPIWDISDELKLPILCHTDCGDISRLLEKRPNARMIMAHMTSDWKTKAEIARAFPGPNLTVEISGAGCGLEDIVKAIEIAGPTRFIFGSDLNCHALNFTLRPLMCSGLPEQTLRAILRDNALRYFSKS
jgi:predicted TIM-barrel fold metal-dependent hydrolase